ncbi:MAG: TraB/GumN family protein [Candidatus Cloacimonetes bacterium]|nr:TraB/GumN family protein [Candidatus Cloacimonadota bacterium]
MRRILFITFNLILLVMLVSCNDLKYHYIEIKYKPNNHIIRIFPYYTFTYIEKEEILPETKLLFEQCDLVILDNDFDAQIRTEYFTIHDEEYSLQDLISKETYTKLDMVFQEENIPIRAIHDLQPWAVAQSTLMNLICNKEFLTKNILLNYVKQLKRNKKIEYVGNSNESNRYFSELPYYYQEQLLLNSIDRYFNPDNFLKLIYLADSGNFKELEIKYNELVEKNEIDQKIFTEYIKPQIDKQINLINENIITHNSIIIITGLNSVLGKYGIIKQLSKDNNFVITYH